MNEENTGNNAKEGSLTQRTFAGMFWLSSSAAAQSVVRIGITIILARLLTPYDFGVIGAALIIIQFAELFSFIGIGPAIVQIPNLTVAHIRTGFSISLLLSIIFAFVTYLSAPLIAQFYAMPELTAVLSFLALNFILRGIAVVSESFLRRDLQFRKLAFADIISYSLGYGVVGVALAWIGFGLWALVAAVLAQSALKAALLFVWQPHPLLFGWDRSARSQMLSLGIGFTTAHVFNYVALKGDYFIVGRWLGAEALGFYSRAYTLMAVPVNLFGGALNNALFATLSRLQDDNLRLCNAFSRGVAVVSLLVMPLAVFMWLLAPQIILVLLGSQWIEVIIPFQVLAVGMFFRTAYKVGDSIILATGRVGKSAKRQALYAAIVLIGSLLGQTWGVVGVAWAITITLFIHYLSISIVAIRMIKLPFRRFLSLHVSGFVVASIIGSLLWVLQKILMRYEVGNFFVLFISTLLFLVLAIILFGLFPRLFGSEGKWLFEIMMTHLKKASPVAASLSHYWVFRKM